MAQARTSLTAWSENFPLLVTMVTTWSVRTPYINISLLKMIRQMSRRKLNQQASNWRTIAQENRILESRRIFLVATPGRPWVFKYSISNQTAIGVGDMKTCNDRRLLWKKTLFLHVPPPFLYAFVFRTFNDRHRRRSPSSLGSNLRFRVRLRVQTLIYINYQCLDMNILLVFPSAVL